MKNRFVFKKVRSGGIVLAYKQYLNGYIHNITTDSTYIKWFEIDKTLFRCEENILFGIVYCQRTA